MSDKNPKHPLKKKKVKAKINVADHEAVEEAEKLTEARNIITNYNRLFQEE